MSEIEKEYLDGEEQQVTRNETKISKCAECGANMVYDPETQSLHCPYCGSEKVLQFDKLTSEQEFSKLFDKGINEWGSETHIFKCQNCGAKEIIGKNEIAKSCPFCGTSNVVETSEVSGLKPNAVLPFLLTKEKASENVIKWAKKKIFAPRKFKKSVKPEGIYGNYSPCFTFDSDTFSRYSGELGEYYYETVTRNGKREQVRRTRWFRISGTHDNFFDDVLITASTDVQPKYMYQLQPFDTNNAQEYSPDYLQGFTATQYTKDGVSCWHEAQDVMKRNIEKQILSKYHYDVVKRLDVSTDFRNVTFKYVLLPLYIGHCDYRKKLFNFFVNGQSGKVSGKTPLSPLKIGLLVLLIIAVGVLLAFIYLKSEGII